MADTGKDKMSTENRGSFITRAARVVLPGLFVFGGAKAVEGKPLQTNLDSKITPISIPGVPANFENSLINIGLKTEVDKLQSNEQSFPIVPDITYLQTDLGKDLDFTSNENLGKIISDPSFMPFAERYAGYIAEIKNQTNAPATDKFSMNFRLGQLPGNQNSDGTNPTVFSAIIKREAADGQVTNYVYSPLDGQGNPLDLIVPLRTDPAYPASKIDFNIVTNVDKSKLDQMYPVLIDSSGGTSIVGLKSDNTPTLVAENGNQFIDTYGFEISEFKHYKITSSDNVNIRPDPSTDHAAVVVLPPGTRIIVINEGDGWSQIVANYGEDQSIVGWVSNKLISPDTQTSTTSVDSLTILPTEQYNQGSSSLVLVDTLKVPVDSVEAGTPLLTPVPSADLIKINPREGQFSQILRNAESEFVARHIEDIRNFDVTKVTPLIGADGQPLPVTGLIDTYPFSIGDKIEGHFSTTAVKIASEVVPIVFDNTNYNYGLSLVKIGNNYVVLQMPVNNTKVFNVFTMHPSQPVKKETMTINPNATLSTIVDNINKMPNDSSFVLAFWQTTDLTHNPDQTSIVIGAQRQKEMDALYHSLTTGEPITDTSIGITNFAAILTPTN